MLKYNFRLALRQLRERPLFSVILIAGLTIGLTAALLVSTIVINDLSYDRMWSKKDRIYRLVSKDIMTGSTSGQTAAPMGPELKRAMPEVEDYCRMMRNDIRLKIGEDPQGVPLKSLEADSSIWNFLDLSILDGNPRTLVAGTDNIVITESMRKRFFGNQNPVGRQLTSINTYSAGDTFIVTGVIRDLPANTHLRADMLVLRTFREQDNRFSALGDGNTYPAYVLFRPNTDCQKLEAKTNTWYKSKLKNYARLTTSFQPMTDVYLRSEFTDNRQPVRGNIPTVYILSGVAVLLLLIACINYVNLTTAAAIKRAKATGIRKILGAGKKLLLRQFLTESFVYFIIGFVLASGLFAILLPALESFTGNPLPLGLYRQWSVFAATGFVVFIVTILTAFYPAVTMSRPNAVTAFSHSSGGGKGSEFFRRGLVILQFAISIVLLIVTTIVNIQLRLLETAPLGYNKENLIVLQMIEWGSNKTAFRNELAATAGVENICLTRWVPAGGAASMTTTIKDPAGTNQHLVVDFISADVNFPQTLGLRLLKGRWLSESYGSDAPNFDSLMQNSFDGLLNFQKTQSSLVTESTARRLGIDELGIPIRGLESIPVGIIADFRNESLKSAPGLCILEAEARGTFGGMLIRVAPGLSTRVKPVIAGLFRKYYPSIVLEMGDAKDLLADQYTAEKKLMQIFYFFSSLIVFLSCMGLFGLVTFLVQSHIKEIGIRKVLGASTERIAMMFTWNFLRLVLVSAFVAVPIGAWLMERWLQDYPFRTELSWWLFVLPLAVAATVAALTVGFQSVRAAMANPADALRSE